MFFRIFLGGWGCLTDELCVPGGGELRQSDPLDLGLVNPRRLQILLHSCQKDRFITSTEKITIQNPRTCTDNTYEKNN